MNVQNALSNIPEKPLGYIRMVCYTDGGEATERTLDSFSNKEILDVVQKQCSAYYYIGEYYYIVYKL